MLPTISPGGVTMDETHVFLDESGFTGQDLLNPHQPVFCIASTILDEATASVDPLTEAQIQEGLDVVLQERTAIVIAHRLSTIKSADRIIVLRHGQIIEEGSHAALIARGGHYAELYDTYFRHQSLQYIESWRKDQLEVSSD